MFVRCAFSWKRFLPMAADTRINERYTTGATPQKNAAFRVHFGHKRPDLSAGGAALWSHENDPLLLKSLSLSHCLAVSTLAYVLSKVLCGMAHSRESQPEEI